MLASNLDSSFDPPARLLWGAEVPRNPVQDERQNLRTLIASDYGQFKTIVVGDMLAPFPVNKSYDELIEDHLRQKFGDAYAPDVK